MTEEELFSKAVKDANKGIPAAMYALGVMHLKGRGTAVDPPKAEEWLLKAHEAGYAQATFQLGLAYMEGKVLAKEPAKGFSMVSEAASSFSPAKQALALCHLNGVHVPKDTAKGLEVLEEASKTDSSATSQLAYLYFTGDMGVEKDTQKALQWARKAADSGNPEAQYSFGSLYRTGEHVEKNWATALYWFQKAAAQGHAYAMNDMAMIIKEGIPGKIEPDMEAALKLFQKSAKLGSGDAYFNLSLYYRELKDEKKFIHNLEEAAKRDHPTGLTNLGLCYASGNSVPRDEKKAQQLLTKASSLGVPQAEMNLALLCFDKKDVEKGMFWLRRAANKGLPEAESMLRELKKNPLESTKK